MKKVLIIEGNDITREHLSGILKNTAFSTIMAESGYKGIEIAIKEKPDIIISSNVLPDMDGYCISNILSKTIETSSIPFIILNTTGKGLNVSNEAQAALSDYSDASIESVTLLDTIDLYFGKEKNSLPVTTDSPHLNCLMQLINDPNHFKLPQDLTCDYRTRYYDKRQTIYREGDAPTTVYMIKDGSVKTVKNGAEGKEFIVGIYEKGEFFGHIAAFQGNEYPDTAVAIEDTEALLIPKDDFLSLINVSHLAAVHFIKMLADDISDKEDRLKTLAYNSVRARVAGALLQLQKKHNQQEKRNHRTYTIHVLRDDLAGLIGTTTESLVRTLTDFKNEHIIETDKGEITVLNPTSLERIKKFS